MRFTSILIAGVFALTATAQSSSAAASGTVAVTGSSAVSSAPEPTDSAQAAVLQCLKNCAEGDVTCRAKCVPVPNPNESDANATTDCVAKCPKGNGTETDIKNYGDCVDGCINRYYFSTGASRPTGNQSGSGGSAGAVTTVSPLVSVVTTGSSTFTTTTGSVTITQAPSGSGSPSGSGAGVSSSSSRAAGDAVFAPVGSSLGLLGFLAAALAL